MSNFSAFIGTFIFFDKTNFLLICEYFSDKYSEYNENLTDDDCTALPTTAKNKKKTYLFQNRPTNSLLRCCYFRNFCKVLLRRLFDLRIFLD